MSSNKSPESSTFCFLSIADGWNLAAHRAGEEHVCHSGVPVAMYTMSEWLSGALEILTN